MLFFSQVHASNPALAGMKYAVSMFVFVIAQFCSAQFLSAPTCDPSTIVCNSQEDTQDCGKVAGVIHDPVCETEKAAQNAIFAAKKAQCEVGKSGAQVACQVVWGTLASAGAYEGVGAALLDHVTQEATEVGMRALPGQLRDGVTQLTKGAVDEISKYPLLAMYLSTQYKVWDPVLSRVVDDIVQRSCSVDATMRDLAPSPHTRVTDTDKSTGILFTPLKDWGISGWSPTGCIGQGEGVLIRDAALSTDGFWTVDVRLLQFSINGTQAPQDRYMRLELEPNLPANSYASKRALINGEQVIFGGQIVYDNDPS